MLQLFLFSTIEKHIFLVELNYKDTFSNTMYRTDHKCNVEDNGNGVEVLMNVQVLWIMFKWNYLNCL